MTRTTPAPELDLAALFPALAPLARQTVRLHPRPNADVPVNASKWGGRFLWTASEGWPICMEPEWRAEDSLWVSADPLSVSAEYERRLKEDTPPLPNHRYIPVLQLRKDDFPEMAFPGDADLFQLLWCPNDHFINISVMCKVIWRKESDVVGPLAEVPTPESVDDDYLPRPCRLHPERVTEYPYQGDLPDDLAEAIQRWEEDRGIEGPYFYEMSVATGTKLGGYVRWIQGNWIPSCERDHKMEHLLTIASREFGGGWSRWYPIEDVQATGLSRSELERDHRYIDMLRDVDRSSGIMLGDAGVIHLFVCRQCPEWPIEYVGESC